ncbi:MAG: LysM peptidoglycan-binding domain-containing protein [Verrucomicrobia bacterium]|nr:LysM peptidoglycan-binding domain-containing protein [Verrucomicrobiota bacterium]
MSTPNPLNPQGSLLEQKAKKKPNLPVVVFIFLAIHAVVLGGILMSGCKKDDAGAGAKKTDTTGLPPINTNDWITQPPTNTAIVTPPAPLPTNPAPLVTPPAPGTNLPVVVTPPSEAPTGTGPTTHIVAKGDSFYSMSKKYGVSMKEIEKANPNLDPKKLKVGDKVNIPAAAPKTASTGKSDNGKTSEPGIYVVKSGDALEKIAKSHGTTVKAIQEANNLPDTRIKVGQKLKIPEGTGAKKSNGTTPAPDASAPPGTTPAPKNP